MVMNGSLQLSLKIKSTIFFQTPEMEIQEDFQKHDILIYLKENVVSQWLITEIHHTEDHFSTKQPEVLAKIMSGKLMTPRNYVLKILTDFFTTEVFSQFYVPHQNTPLINYMLGKKLQAGNRPYEFFEFVDFKHSLKELLHLAKAIKGAKFSYKPEPNISEYAVANAFPNGIDDPILAETIYKNPIDHLDTEGSTFYVKHLEPLAEIITINSSGLIPVRFRNL